MQNLATLPSQSTLKMEVSAWLPGKTKLDRDFRAKPFLQRRDEEPWLLRQFQFSYRVTLTGKVCPSDLSFQTKELKNTILIKYASAESMETIFRALDDKDKVLSLLLSATLLHAATDSFTLSSFPSFISRHRCGLPVCVQLAIIFAVSCFT